MPEDDFYTPIDKDALRMENELLAFEVSFLRARLGWPSTGAGSSNSLSGLARLEEAEQDLVLLLRRLANSPVGPLLRRRKSFRILEERYLHVSESQSPEERVARLESAEKDLVLLLRRLGRPPFGPVLRRRKSFRTLEERYL